MKLKVYETFYSLQGESTLAGFPSFFVRLGGCNLHCAYCDTPEARSGGYETGVEDIFLSLGNFPGVHHVTVTGGEPLIQEGACPLMKALAARGYTVQLETNGSILLDRVPKGVRKIVDVKTPSSGEEGSFLMENLGHVGPSDEIKFVISHQEDYRFAVDFIKKHLEKTGAVINFSPVWGAMDMTALANRILDDDLRVRLNTQLHRILWPGGERG